MLQCHFLEILIIIVCGSPASSTLCVAALGIGATKSIRFQQYLPACSFSTCVICRHFAAGQQQGRANSDKKRLAAGKREGFFAGHWARQQPHRVAQRQDICRSSPLARHKVQ